MPRGSGQCQQQQVAVEDHSHHSSNLPPQTAKETTEWQLEFMLLCQEGELTVMTKDSGTLKVKLIFSPYLGLEC